MSAHADVRVMRHAYLNPYRGMKNLTFGSAFCGSTRKFALTESTNKLTQRRIELQFADAKFNENEIGAIVIDSAYWLHNNLGSGLLENVYETIHTKQLLTYLKLTNTKLGFILNFGSELMKNGIYRIVNGLPDQNFAPFASLRDEFPRNL